MAIDINSFMGGFNQRHHEIQDENIAEEKKRRAQIGQWLQSVYTDPASFESVRQKAHSAYNDLVAMAGDYKKPYKLPKDVTHPEELMHPSQVPPTKPEPAPDAGQAMQSLLEIAHQHNAQDDGTAQVPDAHGFLSSGAKMLPTLMGMPMAGASGGGAGTGPAIPPVPGRSIPEAPPVPLAPTSPTPAPTPLPALGGMGMGMGAGVVGGMGGDPRLHTVMTPEEQLARQSGLDRQKALADLETRHAISAADAEFLRKQGFPEEVIQYMTAGGMGGHGGGANPLLALSGAGRAPTPGLYVGPDGTHQSVVGHFNQVTKTYDTVDGQHLPAGQVHAGPFKPINVVSGGRSMWQLLDASGQPVGPPTMEKPQIQDDVRTITDAFGQQHIIQVPRSFSGGGGGGGNLSPSSTPSPSPKPTPAPEKLNLVKNPRAVGADGQTKPAPKAAENTSALAGLTPAQQTQVREAVRHASTEGNGFEDLKKTFSKPAALMAATKYANDNNIALLNKEDRHVVSAIADAMTVVGDVRRYVKKAQDSSLSPKERLEALSVLKKTVNTFRVKLARGAEGANGVRLTQAEASWASLLPGGDNIDALTIPLLQNYTQDRIDQLVHDIKSFQQNIFEETHRQYSTSGEKRDEPVAGSVDDAVAMIKGTGAGKGKH